MATLYEFYSSPNKSVGFLDVPGKEPLMLKRLPELLHYEDDDSVKFEYDNCFYHIDLKRDAVFLYARQFHWGEGKALIEALKKEYSSLPGILRKR